MSTKEPPANACTHLLAEGELEREPATNETESVDHARLAKERLRALQPAARARDPEDGHAIFGLPSGQVQK